MNLPKIASISKKIVVACVGLFLLLFLLVHLGINLCLLRPDDGAWYIAASNFMGTNYIVKVFEIVLFAVLFIHIVLTIALQIQNICCFQNYDLDWRFGTLFPYLTLC